MMRKNEIFGSLLTKVRQIVSFQDTSHVSSLLCRKPLVLMSFFINTRIHMHTYTHFVLQMKSQNNGMKNVN